MKIQSLLEAVETLAASRRTLLQYQQHITEDFDWHAEITKEAPSWVTACLSPLKIADDSLNLKLTDGNLSPIWIYGSQFKNTGSDAAHRMRVFCLTYAFTKHQRDNDGDILVSIVSPSAEEDAMRHNFMTKLKHITAFLKLDAIVHERELDATFTWGIGSNFDFQSEFNLFVNKGESKHWIKINGIIDKVTLSLDSKAVSEAEAAEFLQKL